MSNDNETPADVIRELTGARMMGGVVMVFVNSEGRVIAHAADFNQSCPGGYTIREAQASRCKSELELAVFTAYASPTLVEATDLYSRASIVRELERKGCRTHTIDVEVVA